MSGLGNDDRVAGFQQQILFELLTLHDVLVVEAVVRRLATFGPHDLDVPGLGVLSDAACEREQMKHRRRCRQL